MEFFSRVLGQQSSAFEACAFIIAVTAALLAIALVLLTLLVVPSQDGRSGLHHWVQVFLEEHVRNLGFVESAVAGLTVVFLTGTLVLKDSVITAIQDTVPVSKSEQNCSVFGDPSLDSPALCTHAASLTLKGLAAVTEEVGESKMHGVFAKFAERHPVERYVPAFFVIGLALLLAAVVILAWRVRAFGRANANNDLDAKKDLRALLLVAFCSALLLANFNALRAENIARTALSTAVSAPSPDPKNERAELIGILRGITPPVLAACQTCASRPEPDMGPVQEEVLILRAQIDALAAEVHKTEKIPFGVLAVQGDKDSDRLVRVQKLGRAGSTSELRVPVVTVLTPGVYRVTSENDPNGQEARISAGNVTTIKAFTRKPPKSVPSGGAKTAQPSPKLIPGAAIQLHVPPPPAPAPSGNTIQ